MLRSFRVANHKSIRDEQELLLMPAYDKSRPVVPVAAIYGANASGKSNLLDALAFVKTAVADSYRRWEPTEGIPRTPFRLDPESQGKPSWYVLEAVIDGVAWTYGFEVDDQVVREEWLYSHPRGRRRVIFERKDGRLTFGSTVKVGSERLRALSQLTRDNSLFLSVGAQSAVAEVMPMYEWLRSDLHAGEEEVDEDTPSHEERLIEFLRTNSNRIQEIIGLVAVADLGIVDVGVEAVSDYAKVEATLRRAGLIPVGDEALDTRPADLKRLVKQALSESDSKRTLRLRFRHGNDVAFGLEDESQGTRAWLALLPDVLDILSGGHVCVIDEIDTSLHPRLVVRLIELFRDERTNPHGAQLIFTTHDATLLGTSFGRPVLGRDEVWFVEKDRTGATKLFPLSDFRPRKEENWERRYLGGAYGAVPAVYSDTLVERLLESRREAPDAAS